MTTHAGDALTLSLCSKCKGQAPEVGVCPLCGGAGCFDNHGEPFHAPPPFHTWTAVQLVRLSDTSLARPRGTNARVMRGLQGRHALSDRSSQPAPPAQPHARRLTLSDVVELAFATINRSGADHSTVKLSRNARGDTQIEVSVRTGEQGIATVEEASAKAREVYDRIASAYPIADTPAPTPTRTGPTGVVSDRPKPAKRQAKRERS